MNASMLNIAKWLKNISVVFSLFFCFELIFGYSGTMVMIRGISIRHILFILAGGSLYLYCLCYVIINRIKLFSPKDDRSIFATFNFLDWSLLLLIISTAVSFLIIPQIYQGDLQLAKSEILDSLCMLLLYYPIRFMLKWGELSLEKLYKVVLIFISILAALHIILYVGQTLNVSFIENYFKFLSFLSGGTAITPGSVLGHGGYPRVMYSTSIYLLVGFYLVLIKLPKWKVSHFLLFELYLVALLTTMTKSLWYGALAGLVIFTVYFVLSRLKAGQWRPLLKWLSVLVFSCLLIFVLNATLFNGLIQARVDNSFAISNGNGQYYKPGTKGSYGGAWDSSLEHEGAVISNDIKLTQTKLLLEAWQEHPVFGIGYGSYLKNYIRSDIAKFSYEMFLPSMLFKVGIFGVFLMVMVIVAAIITCLRNTAKNRIGFFAWLFLLSAFVLCIQTNPLLLSFNGISVLLFLLWSCHTGNNAVGER